MSRPQPELRSYTVVGVEGTVHSVTAHFVFDNTAEGAGGLVFRRYRDDEPSKTRIVCQFANGSWAYFKEDEKTNG